MDNYNKIIDNNVNFTQTPTKYLDLVRNEIDKEKRFEILKKYFTETITNNVCENMNLLNTLEVDFDQFKNIYATVAKDLSLKILLAVDVLVTERQNCCSVLQRAYS